MKLGSTLFLCTIIFISCKKNNDSSQNNSNLTQGLVAYYPFSGNANDATSNHNNGTVTGASLTADRFGNSNQAYSFNGTSDYINISTSSSLDLKESFSISAWVRPDNYQLPGIVVWHGDPAYAHDPFILYFSNNPGYNSLGVRRDANDGLMINELYAQSGVIFSGIWSHIVATCNATAKQMNIYINGELINSSSFSDMSINYNTNNFFTMIGAATSTGGIGNFFKGKLNEIRIYNRELTKDEIKQLFNL